MTEHQIQNQIRDLLSYFHELYIMRANVGTGWIGDFTKNADGSIRINKPRRFQTGLPVGFPDLFGYKSLIITPEMIGKKIAQFAFIEVKTPKGKLNNAQKEMHKQLIDAGAVGGVARSVEDALNLLKSEVKNNGKQKFS